MRQSSNTCDTAAEDVFLLHFTASSKKKEKAHGQMWLLILLQLLNVSEFSIQLAHSNHLQLQEY